MSSTMVVSPSDDQIWLYDPRETQKCTDPFYRFIVEYDKIVGLFLFITSSAASIDQMQAIAAHALADEKERQRSVDEFNKQVNFSRVKSYSALLSRNLVISMTDNFHSYLSELLQEV